MPFVQFIPTAATFFTVAPLALAYGVVAAAISSVLRRRGVRAPFTRKCFHFLVISAAALVHLRWAAPGVAVFSAVIALLVTGAVMRGRGFAFYDALARPTDEPRAAAFIIVPLLTTALGGILTNLLFPAFAHIGYVAVAWGDAVGEPVGTRWGRRRYRVPSIFGVPAQRSVEGSVAVFGACLAGISILLMAGAVAPLRALAIAAVAAAACALAEAVSHHGTDNLTVQVVASAVTAWLVG